MRSDLTSAAQIREAAMRLFGERGLTGVSVRDVAREAGVSPALVIHHYRSKDGLKAAVDERAMALLGELFAKASDPANAGGSMGSMVDLFADEIGQFPTLLPYLRRLLVDGGPPADQLFGALYEATRAALDRLAAAGLVSPAPDEEARAAFLLVNDMGAVILRDQIRAVLGFDPMSPAGVVRWGEAVLDAYTRPVFTPPKEDES